LQARGRTLSDDAGRPTGARQRAGGRDELEWPVLEEGVGAQGSVGQRVQVHVTGAKRAVRNQLARRRRKGRRRRAEQGHLELAMTRWLHADFSATGSERACALRRHTRGVTLLEMLIVLSIMAVLAALVLPRFTGGVSMSELKGATREIAAGLRFARSEAL